MMDDFVCGSPQSGTSPMSKVVTPIKRTATWAAKDKNQKKLHLAIVPIIPPSPANGTEYTPVESIDIIKPYIRGEAPMKKTIDAVEDTLIMQ